MEDILTLTEFATHLRISTKTAAKILNRGDAPGAYRTGKFGGHWKIPTSALHEYLRVQGLRALERGVE